jgi:hypothetical protein
MRPSNSDFEFISENPEAMEWLKSNIEDRFWSTFESLAKEQKEESS